MNPRKFIIRETALLGAGELLCVAAMVGVFAMLGNLDYRVILGGVLGALIAVGNFFFMAVGVTLAAVTAKPETRRALEAAGAKVVAVGEPMPSPCF